MVEGRENITAASAAYLNWQVEPTPQGHPYGIERVSCLITLCSFSWVSPWASV